MDKLREFLGATSLYGAMLVGVMVGNWASTLETQYGLEETAPWVMPLAVAVFGWVLAGILWKALIAFGLPRFFIPWPRWTLIPVTAVAIMTVAIYGIIVFAPDIPRPLMLAALAVIPLLPASHWANLRLRREFEEDFEAD